MFSSLTVPSSWTACLMIYSSTLTLILPQYEYDELKQAGFFLLKDRFFKIDNPLALRCFLYCLEPIHKFSTNLDDTFYSLQGEGEVYGIFFLHIQNLFEMFSFIWNWCQESVSILLCSEDRCFVGTRSKLLLKCNYLKYSLLYLFTPLDSFVSNIKRLILVVFQQKIASRVAY